jgi:23S rRNA pseudouridine2605 synthase
MSLNETNNESQLKDNPEMIRLNRYMASCGLGSRRECDKLIAEGAVTVNGEKVTVLGVKVNPASDKIFFKGTEVASALPLEYIAYNKPRAVMVTASDPEGRDTVYDSLKRSGIEAGHLKYVGRLDYDSEGLLLMTNDGALIHALTHPKFGVKKTYMVLVDRLITQAVLDQFVTEGIESEGQILRAARIMAREDECREPHKWYEMDLFEGKNRQIRRMIEAAGYQVLLLKRVQFGVVKLRELETGAWRKLEEREVKGLYNIGYPIDSKRNRSA